MCQSETLNQSNNASAQPVLIEMGKSGYEDEPPA